MLDTNTPVAVGIERVHEAAETLANAAAVCRALAIEAPRVIADLRAANKIERDAPYVPTGGQEASQAVSDRFALDGAEEHFLVALANARALVGVLLDA